jgi:transformation/transcription domain-associated protein
MIVEPQKLAYNKSQSSVSKEFNGPIAKVSFPGYTGFVELSLDKAIEASLSILKSSSSADTFYKKNAFKLVASFLASLVNSTLDSDSIYNLFLNFNPSTSSTFTQYLIKATKFTSDEQMRKMVEQSLSSLFYASHAKEIRAPVLRLLDSITIHFTLISLSLYLASSHQGDDTNTSTTTPNVNSTHLDFMILIDSLFEVLCHDDTEYWPCVQRVILLMIETSEVVSYDDSAVRITSADNIYRPNLVNLALFDYLAEKVGQLCYERSWYAKKAGCFVIRLLSRRMPFIWVLNNSYAFIRSLMFILVAVTGEVRIKLK